MTLGSRGYYFRNKWEWGFFLEGLLVLLTLGRDCQFRNEYLKGVLNFVKYLDNGYKKY